MGEAKRKTLARQNQPIALDTFGGRIHVEWDSADAVTPLGQLPFFIDFLKVSGLFDAWIASFSHNTIKAAAPTASRICLLERRDICIA
jgi:hypothetical protein